MRHKVANGRDPVAMVKEAVACYFDDAESAPKIIRLHFVRDEVLQFVRDEVMV